MRSRDLSGSTALVTGAAGGIGGGFVQALLDAGAAHVYAASRDGRGVRDNDRVGALGFDVTDPTAITEAVAHIDRLDLLVNSAGTATPLDLATGDLDDLRRDMAVHVVGPVEVTRALLPALERQRGAIVNILSIAAIASIPGIEASAASKAATLSLTQAMRTQLHPRGLTVHAVFPGPVDTPLIAELDTPKSPALDVARATLAAVAAGDEDIFPDPASQTLSHQWGDPTKRIERQLAETPGPPQWGERPLRPAMPQQVGATRCGAR